MGVTNGQAVSAAVTNNAFLNKNQADTMTFPLALTNNLALSKRDEASAATINALVTTSTIVRITGTVTGINGAVAPTVFTDGSLLIISNASASPIGLANESASATAVNRFNLGGTNLTISPGQAASFYYDNTSSRWRPSAGSGSGGGLSAWTTSFVYVAGNVVTNGNNTYICLIGNTSGATFAADFALGYWRQLDQPVAGRNYMSVGSNFESNTVEGWQLFTTTLTGVIPTGSLTLGTAASLSIAVTGTSPISNSYSLVIGNTASTNIAAGQGIISQVYTIDQIDQARVLTERFSYKVNANSATAPLNLSGTSSNTLAVYVYDVTNSAWIQPAGVYGLNQSSGVGLQVGTWQTPSTMTQFRLAILCVNATTAATPAVNTYQILLDEFSVGPQVVQYGAPVTDWQSYTPTYSGLGTVTGSALYYRRAGDSIQIVGKFTTGTVAATTPSITLPAGLSVDTSKITSTIVGRAQRGLLATGSGEFYNSIIVDTANPTQLFFSTANNGLTEGSKITNATSNFANSEAQLVSFCTVPIAGFSSSVQMSNDTDTRVVSFAATGNVAATGANIALVYPTTTFDTHGGYNATTGKYTIPVPGVYRFTASIFANHGASTTFQLYKNNVAQSPQSGSADSSGFILGSFLQSFVAGDVVDIRTNNASTAPSNARNLFAAERLSGPSAIAASETVSCGYISTSGQSLGPAQTTIIFGTKEWDSHSFYNSATGVATIPVSGRYRATLGISMTSTAVCSFNVIQAGSVSKNKQLADKPLTTIFQHNGSAEFQCIAGDTLTFVATTTVAAAMSTSANVNYIYITRVGN